MRILLTGQHGYLGTILAAELEVAGHQVAGLDTCYYCQHPRSAGLQHPGFLQKDLRDIGPQDLKGFAAVIHLAALSNDPVGEINPALTEAINHQASVQLAKLAKAAGVERFLFSSTCSVYGIAEAGGLATEAAPLRPQSAYALSKVRTEEDLSNLADAHFSPVYLRNATAYGWSEQFRADLVLNNLAAWAFTTGEIRILSDGTPWRPLVHVRDIAGAFLAALTAPRAAVHNQAFNIGANRENYQVRDLAAIVQEAFSGCRVRYAGQAGPDPRSYRVDFTKAAKALQFRPRWDVPAGVQELREAFHRTGLAQKDLCESRYTRLSRLKELLQASQLDDNLRWRVRAS